MDESMIDFIHPLLNEEITTIAGYYVITREVIIPHQEGPVLSFVGFASTESSCCGAGGCGYAIVAGRIIELHSGISEDNRTISRVIPLEDRLHREVFDTIRLKEGVGQVHFLLKSGERKVMY